MVLSKFQIELLYFISIIVSFMWVSSKFHIVSHIYYIFNKHYSESHIHFYEFHMGFIQVSYSIIYLLHIHYICNKYYSEFHIHSTWVSSKFHIGFI